ncbi:MULTISPECIES: sialidase family protein [Streptomyces]|uniref:sialidase family protein n=1 Tax=Streptomyces lycopersici TaxID=2974589 RepID=UPI0021D1F293|nr:sialidase family protein [Streptomyces sp. NEAU-383]
MSRRRTGHHHARKVAAAAVAAVAAFGLTACQGDGDTKAGSSTASQGSGSQGSGSPDAEAKNGEGGEGGAAALRKTGPKPLRDGTGLYPRAIRLEHSGKDNGRVLASTVVPNGGNGIGAIQESTDGGANFNQVGTVADPKSADGGKGLCCATLYELPQQVGDMPAGTLLWAASFGQDEPESSRHMSIRVFKSTDVGRTWSPLSTVATATNANGLWEPEFSIDADGNLVCHYSDETDPNHSQKLVAVRSRDGVSWDGLHDTVAGAPVSDRPGMAVVRKVPDGKYVMTYEICSKDPKFSCVVHVRTSSDGWDWGDPANLGTRPETADGKYFRHAPTLAWAPEDGNPQGKLLLVGQVMYNADGSKAEGSGRTVWTNSEGGEGAWKEIPAPVAVKSDKVDFCPNYSSSLLPSADGRQLLEIATDYDGEVRRPYHATDGM